MRRITAIAFLCTVTFFTRAQVFNITTYGAVGDSTTLCTSAIQAAIDSCHNAGGGTVEVPSGTFLTGTLFLKSNVNFHLSQGAAIKGSGGLGDYPIVNPLTRSVTDDYPQTSVFYAEGQHNISFTGEGTFNGDGFNPVWLINSDNKPFGFRFFSCTNIRFTGVTLINSGFWMMHQFNTDTLVIKNVRIVNQAWGNNDGFDFDGCKNVLLDSCFVDCNDDPIVMKATSLYGCRDIEIKNCTVGTYSRGIKIGTESYGAFKNIHVHNCKVQFSTLGPFGSNNPGKCGINLSVVDGGSMENVVVEDIEMAGIKTALSIRLGNRGQKYTDTAAVPAVGFVRNVELKNITATVTTNVTSSITGILGYDAQNIRLKNIDITYPGGWPALPPYYPVPENASGRPEATIFGDTLPASGLYIRHVDSMWLQNVCFHAQQPDGRPEFFLDDVTNLDTSGLCGGFVIGMPEIGFEGDVNIYPNPVTGSSLNLQVSEGMASAELTVYDVAGREVKHITLMPGTQVLNISEFKAGLYFIRLHKNGNAITKKLLKL